jgi:hypothetical protein
MTYQIPTTSCWETIRTTTWVAATRNVGGAAAFSYNLDNTSGQQRGRPNEQDHYQGFKNPRSALPAAMSLSSIRLMTLAKMGVEHEMPEAAAKTPSFTISTLMACAATLGNARPLLLNRPVLDDPRPSSYFETAAAWYN